MINPIYKYLAVILVVLGALGAAYTKGRIDCSATAEIKMLEADLEVARGIIFREQQARAVDEINAVAAKARLDILERKATDLYDYAQNLEDGDAVCLDSGDTERLRDLWD